MTAYNIDSVSRLMNEDLETPTKKQKETGDAMGNKPAFLQKKAKTPEGNPFAKKDDGKGNPFAKKVGKKGKPFAKKGGKKGKPFADKGETEAVEESINRLLHLLEVLDPSSLRSKNKAYRLAPRKPGAPKLTVGHDPMPSVAGKPKPRSRSLPDGNKIWQNQRALQRKGSNYQQDKGPVKKNIGTKDPNADIAAKMARMGIGPAASK